MKAKGDCRTESTQVPLRSDGSQGSQAGRLDCVSVSQRLIRGGHQARVHSDQMFPVVIKQEAGPH
jgi:hypothetical protein